VIQQAFNNINQKTIIKQVLPNSLYKFYIERFAAGDVNKYIYQFYCFDQKVPQK
jgi:hypothetical protein